MADIGLGIIFSQRDREHFKDCSKKEKVQKENHGIRVLEKGYRVIIDTLILPSGDLFAKGSLERNQGRNSYSYSRIEVRGPIGANEFCTGISSPFYIFMVALHCISFEEIIRAGNWIWHIVMMDKLSYWMMLHFSIPFIALSNIFSSVPFPLI